MQVASGKALHGFLDRVIDGRRIRGLRFGGHGATLQSQMAHDATTMQIDVNTT